MPTTESMKVFRSACDQLGKVLEASGFEYRKSRREARRNGRLFDHLINFRTSRSINSLEGHVHLEVTATAWSEAFGVYRRAKGVDLPINEACLFDTPIENIFQEAPPYIRYDIGDEDERPIVLATIRQVLNEQVLMVFDMIEAPGQLRRYLDSHQVPCLDPFSSARDYFGFVQSET